MGDVSTPRGADPVAAAGFVVWALAGMLLALIALRGLGVASLLGQLLGAGGAAILVIGFVSWIDRDEHAPANDRPALTSHPLDGCARALQELQTHVLPGPVHDHLLYLRQAIDAERRQKPTPGIEARGRELVAATERLVVAHHELVGARLTDPIARTVALESTLRSFDDDLTIRGSEGISE